MELLGVVLVLIFIWGVWTVTQPHRVFSIQVKRGEARAVKGKVTPAFLQRVREVFEGHYVQNGTVSGVVRGGRVSLQFSRQVPQPACQQLRNWWANSGWGEVKKRA